MLPRCRQIMIAAMTAVNPASKKPALVALAISMAGGLSQSVTPV